MSKATDLLNKLPPEQAAKVKELVARQLVLDEAKKQAAARKSDSKAKATKKSA